jgi:DNA-binding response OmpR family regulator
MLPGMDGLEVCRRLRAQRPEALIVMLTAKTAEIDRVLGLELGADDYVTKPFSAGELVARIHAVLRRTDTLHDLKLTPNFTVGDEPFDFLGATVNGARMEITFADGATETLGRKELGILAHLYENKGKIIPRKNMIHAVWGPHANVKSRSLDQYIVKVRDLFKRHGCNDAPFRTVHGVGFIYDPDGESKA